MSTLAFPAKTVAGSGTTSYVDGQSLPASELQADFDAVALIVNGDLDEDNLKSATQIPSSKLAPVEPDNIDDHAGNAATFVTQTTPGDTGTPSLPTHLAGELERIRYRLQSLNGYRTNVKYFTAADAEADASWIEPPVVGSNLFKNSSFEKAPASSGDPPDGWTEEGTLAGSAMSAIATTLVGKEKRAFGITCSASPGDGISQILTGLKGSTKYLIGVEFSRTMGGLSVSTAGGLASGSAYQDFTISDSATSGITKMQGIVQTDTAATDLTVSMVGTTGSDLIFFVSAWAFELGDAAPNYTPHIPEQVVTIATQSGKIPGAGTFPAGFTWENISGLSLSQYIPSPGYRLVYEVQIAYTGPKGAAVSALYEAEYGFRVQMDDGGGAVDVDGPYLIYSSTNGPDELAFGGLIAMKHVVEFPTPGLTYAFTTDAGAYNDGTRDMQMVISPLSTASSVQSISKARLFVERI